MLLPSWVASRRLYGVELPSDPAGIIVNCGLRSISFRPVDELLILLDRFEIPVAPISPSVTLDRCRTDLRIELGSLVLGDAIQDVLVGRATAYFVTGMSESPSLSGRGCLALKKSFMLVSMPELFIPVIGLRGGPVFLGPPLRNLRVVSPHKSALGLTPEGH